MRVIERFNNDDMDEYHFYEVELTDDKGNTVEKMSVSDSCDTPEDNTLGRSFADIYQVVDMIKAAYEAGKNGEDLTFAKEEE